MRVSGVRKLVDVEQVRLARIFFLRMLKVCVFLGGVAATPLALDHLDGLWCVTEFVKSIGKRETPNLQAWLRFTKTSSWASCKRAVSGARECCSSVRSAVWLCRSWDCFVFPGAHRGDLRLCLSLALVIDVIDEVLKVIPQEPCVSWSRSSVVPTPSRPPSWTNLYSETSPRLTCETQGCTQRCAARLKPFWLKPFWLKPSCVLSCAIPNVTVPRVFSPTVVPAMSFGSSTRSGDRKVYVPTLSELHRRHGRAKQFCAKTDCNGSFCAYDVLRSHENGRPSPAPNAAVRLPSQGYSLTMVHWCGHSARSLVGAKRLQRSPQQRGSVSWRHKSRICSSSWPSQLRQQDKAKLIPLWSTTLRWTPRRVRSTPCARRSKISRPIWRGPTLGSEATEPPRWRPRVVHCDCAAATRLGSWAAGRVQNPPSQRMAAAQQCEAKCIKAEKAAADLAASAKLALELATKEAQEAEQALRVAQDELAKATAEVGALAAQRASGAVRDASLADSPNEAHPGFIREDYATSLWLEREQNIQSLIAEAVATALARQQGQSSAAPSEAPTDDAPIFSGLESIDHFADDDSSWTKLDKGKRKALVKRETAEMAGKPKTTILKRVHGVQAQQPAHGHPMGLLAWNQDWRGSGTWAL